MTFAIIETGGKQYRIAEDEAIAIEKLGDDLKAGDTVTFDKVLLVSDGKKTEVGTPYLDGITVSATFNANARAPKVTVVRYKAKSRYYKKRGHRQPQSHVTVSKIKA